MAKTKSPKSVKNKSIRQSEKGARGLYGKKGQDRIAAAKGRLGGGGPSAHPPSVKPRPTSTQEPSPAPGSPEDRNLSKIGSRFKPDELEL